MPYSKRANSFFNLCAHNPSSAYKKCPPKAQAAKMAHEGVKAASSKLKKRTVPRADKNGYY